MTATPRRGASGNERAPLDWAILVGAAACAVIGAWLLAVVVTVLPSRSPDAMLPWSAVAIGFLAFAALTAWHGLRGPRLLEPLSSVAAVLAVVGGAWIASPVVIGSVEFEGYVVLIGVAAVMQGLLVLASLVARRASTR